MCPECKNAGDLFRGLIRSVELISDETARMSIISRVKNLHDSCSFVSCTCQHKIPEIRNV